MWMGIRMGFPSGRGSGWESHLDGDPDGFSIRMEIWMGISSGQVFGWESHLDGDLDGMNLMWMGFRMGIPSGWGSGLNAGGWIWHYFLTLITVHWSLRLKDR